MNEKLWRPALCLLSYLLATAGGTFALAHEAADRPDVAQRPPMGWNSFDAYDCRINEQEYRKVVDFMAGRMKPLGWEYVVIDYIWFNPEPGAWKNPNRRHGHPDLKMDDKGRPVDDLVMDKWGRLLPAVDRFPSAEGGKGFGPLAEYVHSKGLKFGIHIMRGIPRQAYYEDTPIKGSDATASQIAEPWDTCNWCNNMYGIDAAKTGSQEYYNSLFDLYAEWGVDYIKADDTMYPPYHAGEIEMMHKAIEQCGRPMVLSLSCGEAPLSRAQHLLDNANMWRISADFWDEWEHLRHSFDLMNSWSGYTRPGHWPDADMIPIGPLSLDNRPHGPERQSKFTWDEHQTLMTLWCIGKSPLMWGGDPLTVSEKSLSYLTNQEVIDVNQRSVDNRQVFLETRNNSCCWVATDPDSGDRYVALFNLGNEPQRVSLNLEWEHMRGKYNVRDLWAGEDDGQVQNRIARELPPHGAGLYRLTKAD